GGHCDHCDSGQHAPAGAGPGQRGRQPHQVRQQPPANGAVGQDVCGRQRRPVPPAHQCLALADAIAGILPHDQHAALPDRANRSYLINGWNDYFADAMTTTRCMKELAVIYPSETLMFGEKKNEPTPAMDYFMDLNEGVGNDLDKVEQGCHSASHKQRNAGGSNFVFVDGSVRYKRFGATVWPLNLWAVND